MAINEPEVQSQLRVGPDHRDALSQQLILQRRLADANQLTGIKPIRHSDHDGREDSSNGLPVQG